MFEPILLWFVLTFNTKQFCVQGPTTHKWVCDKGDAQKTRFYFEDGQIEEYVDTNLRNVLQIKSIDTVDTPTGKVVIYKTRDLSDKKNVDQIYLHVPMNDDSVILYLTTPTEVQKFKFYNKF